MNGKVLKELRETSDITQIQLANILNINRVQYNQYENDYNNIPTKHLNTICNYFNVSIDYVFSLTNKRQYLNSKKDINLDLSSFRLKEFRKSNQLTQEKLAKILNTNRSVLANYERGRTIIASPFLYSICSEYHISADYLLGKTDEPQYLN